MQKHSYLKLESAKSTSDLDRGIRAEIHDPLWFLAKQWLMFEYQGEDAGIPVSVEFKKLDVQIKPFERSLPSPGEHPVESIVEGSNSDFWTPGRRLRLGALYKRGLFEDSTFPSALLIDDLPPPYERFNGNAIDGQKAYEDNPGHLVFASVPKKRPDGYLPGRFEHVANFRAAKTTLTVRSRGDTIDWFSCKADKPPSWPSGTECQTRTEPIRFPGMPNPRWWEIEGGDVDPARYGFDRSHFAMGLFIELLAGVSHEWSGFVWETTVGSITSLKKVKIIDTFEDKYDVSPPMGWSLFRIRGITDPHLLFWANASAPVRGDALEVVRLSVDEDTGYVWAQESRLAGRDVDTSGTDFNLHDAAYEADKTTHIYRPIRGIRRNVHPYVPTPGYPGKKLIQGRLAELGGEDPVWMPLPRAELLGANKKGIHNIEAGVVLDHGLELSRRWLLARDTNGQPVLWLRRSSCPIDVPLSSLVRFDTVQRRDE